MENKALIDSGKNMDLSLFQELYTERLLLRRINEDDWAMILFLRSDKDVTKFIQRAESEKTKTKEDALNFIAKINKGIDDNKFVSWGISLKESSEIIGSICLWNFSDDMKTAEVGYDLSPKCQGLGIMSESLIRVVAYGFDVLNLDKIEAFTNKYNKSSKALLERNGFELNRDGIDQGNNDNIIFEKTKH